MVLPVTFMDTVKGRVNQVNTSSGRASSSAVRSGICRAIVLGISSPKTTCMKVMSMKAAVTASVWAVTNRQASGIRSSSGSISRARAGSPTKPRAILARVMPSWVAAMERLMPTMALST